MLGVWIGAIQNMYPELGAGVEDHSILLREPLQRVARSVYPIMGVVYDGAHAPFFMLIIKTAEYFCGGLTEAEKRQLFAEHVQWYRMYGMSMRPVPDSWEDFQEYWERVGRD